MRIVLVGTAFPLRGGIAHYIALLHRALIKRGHEVHILSFKRQYPSLFFPGKTQIDKGKELIPVRSIPLLDSINPITWIKTIFWLKTVKPDLVVFKYWMPFFGPCYATIVFFAKIFYGIPSCYICDNIVPHDKKIGDRLLTHLALRFVDGFVVQSKTVKRDLLTVRMNARYQFAHHPIYNIFPPAVDKTAAKSKLGIKEKNTILFFGYIRPYKGLNILIEAMTHILEKIPLRLIICGEFYEGREQILSLIKQKNLGSSITIEDRFIPNQEVGIYFSAADLVVLPYLTATQSGIVQIAYNYNVPVIVTDVGGLPEVVVDGKTGYIVQTGNPKALAKSIIGFFKKNKYHDFSQNIRKVKQKYSWEHMAKAIESFIP